MGKFDIKGIVSDIDGVWFQGNRLQEGAHEFMEAVRRRGWKMSFASNGAGSREGVVEKFGNAGIEIAKNDVTTAGYATALTLKEEQKRFKKDFRALFLGPPELEIECATAGVHHFLKEQDVWDTKTKRWIADDTQTPSHVVVARHDFTQGTIEAATAALRRGGKWIATGMDHVVTTETQDYRAGTGTLVAAIQRMLASTGATSRPMPQVQGKPNPKFVQTSLDRMQLRPEETAMLGDSLETDMSVATALKMRRWLVMSGVTKVLEHSKNGDTPYDLVLTDIAALREAIELS